MAIIKASDRISVFDRNYPNVVLFFAKFFGILKPSDPKQKHGGYRMTIGKNIAELRKNNGMTQEQLAEILGVSSQSVSKWENDVTMPDIMLLPTIAGCFNITVDELYGGRKTKEKRKAVDYDDIPEMLYDTIIDLTQRGWVDSVEGKDIEEENAKMKAYLGGNRQVKTATFSNKNGAVIATSQIALLHRGKANTTALTNQGIGRVLEILAKPTVRQIFAYETEHFTEYLTAAYAAKKCGISPDDAAEALEMLTEIHINYVKEVMLDEANPIRIYSLDSGEWVMYTLMLLKIARLMDENLQHYYNYRGSYNNLWLK